MMMVYTHKSTMYWLISSKIYEIYKIVMGPKDKLKPPICIKRMSPTHKGLIPDITLSIRYPKNNAIVIKI